MATFTVSATNLMYSSDDIWTYGMARQGVYSSTRYEGVQQFLGLDMKYWDSMEVSEISLKVTIGAVGRDGTKNLTFYKSTEKYNQNDKDIDTLRGDYIGEVSLTKAYNSTKTVKFNSTTNAEMFHSLLGYFQGKNTLLILYVPTTRGTTSSGYCYDYMQITAASLTVTYEYVRDEGYLVTTSVYAGETSKFRIVAHDFTNNHNVEWRFGDHKYGVGCSAGIVEVSCPIPISWMDAMPNSLFGDATVTLETLDSTGKLLGSITYDLVIVAAPEAMPTFSEVIVSPVNSNSTLSSWGIFAYGRSRARITIVGAEGSYGSTIRSYSITTSPSIGSSTSQTFTTDLIYQTGTITVTAKITDSRGRTVSKETTFTCYPYAAPYFQNVQAYRSNSFGTRDDMNGTCANILTEFGCYELNGNNKVTGRVVLEQVGGSFSTSTNLISGFSTVMGNGNLAVDATYLATMTLTDSLGTQTIFTAQVLSASYIMHIKKGGKAQGFGVAAGEDETITFGWPLILKKPLDVDQGGTGSASPKEALERLGAVSKSGDTMTGNQSISEWLYPSVFLKPTIGDTTNQVVFEGSYLGAASFAAWEDDTGNDRRMLEVRTADYEPSLDNAVMMRSVISGDYSEYRVFHSGMDSPIPVENGGTGGSNGKEALERLGVFYSDVLPESGEDGQICLVPAS